MIMIICSSLIQIEDNGKFKNLLLLRCIVGIELI